MARHDPESRCTPVNLWPKQDQEAWVRALQPQDPFDLSIGYALRWKETTRTAIEGGYGRWLGWLERSGHLDPNVPPGSRATRERVGEYHSALRGAGLADNSIAGRLQQLCQILRAIAQDGDWSWIHRAASRIYSGAVLVRDPAKRMQPVEEVLRLGCDLMQAAEKDRFRTPCDRAKLFRDGLMIAFLSSRPLRLANLADFTLNEHLEECEGKWRARIAGEQTKGGEAIHFDWPQEFVAQLEIYLSVHRLELLKAAGAGAKRTNSLWISQRGTSMGRSAIAFQIASRTKEEFGIPINPHTFRHIVATAIASANPENARAIAEVLGHGSMRSSEKHYNRAKTLAATSSYQMSVATFRRLARLRKRSGS